LNLLNEKLKKVLLDVNHVIKMLACAILARLNELNKRQQVIDSTGSQLALKVKHVMNDSETCDKTSGEWFMPVQPMVLLSIPNYVISIYWLPT
jgi:hypothetical protein